MFNMRGKKAANVFWYWLTTPSEYWAGAVFGVLVSLLVQVLVDML